MVISWICSRKKKKKQVCCSSFLISDVGECASSPCQNDGSCTEDENGYVCECTIGWEGTNCKDRK